MEERDPFIESLPEENGKKIMAFGRLRIDRKLTTGQLSTSYLAQHLGLNLPVVLRVMRPSVVKRITQVDPLMRAGQKLARIRHANIATIYDLGSDTENPYMVLEYVSGVPMCERMKIRPYTEWQALQLLLPIADGLSALWRHGLLHRGLSPHRISIAADGVPMLDIVILPRGKVEPIFLEAHTPFMAGFWPPEEIRGDSSVDPRSDMFSFGATMYYAITGQSPYGKGTTEELMRRPMEQEPLDLKVLAPEAHPAYHAFVMRCLRKESRDRFGSIQEFVGALKTLQLAMTRSPSAPSHLPSPGDFAREAGAQTAYSTGDSIGNCKLLEEVGRGAFGIVYRARHRTLDIDVAVKFLPMEIAQKDPTFIEMFLREARTAARIRHPNVIGIYEAGEQNGQYYLVMEFAPNGTIKDRMEGGGGKIGVQEGLRLFIEAAKGLSAADKMNIIHRDIKPENLMFGRDNELKIADLGLAKRLPSSDENDKTAIVGSIAQDLITMNHDGGSKIMGTPAYMAPEIATDPEKADIRSDLYSLGVTMYHVFTGALPFHGKSALETILMHVQKKPRPLELIEPSIPSGISAIILKLMEKDPDQRFQSANELVKALEELAGVDS